MELSIETPRDEKKPTSAQGGSLMPLKPSTKGCGFIPAPRRSSRTCDE